MLVDALLSLGLTGWLLALVVFLVSSFLIGRKSDPSFPPTPGLELPLIGHGHLLKKNPVLQFREWRKSVGDVFALKLGVSHLVVINGYNNIKEALIKQADAVSDRAPSALAPYFDDAENGILTSSGPDWKEQRTVSLSILREFGMGKNSLAEKVVEEVDVYINEISKRKGQPMEIRHLTTQCISNIICSIIFGHRYELDDPDFNALIQNFNEVVQFLTASNPALSFPFLRRLPGDPFNFQRLIQNSKDSRIFVKATVNKHLKNCEENEIRSFGNAYVREMKSKTSANVPTYMDEKSLYRVVEHLFIAGTETTSNAITWCVLFMIHNPEVQEKVYQEIVDVVGTSRTPTMADKPKLRYLGAVTNETLRRADILPLNLIHYTIAPVQVAGYTIPAGCRVTACLDSVLMDDVIWGDPENFRPERFLDEDGNLLNPEELVPFSLGRRICLGEALAKMELFLYLATMFQRFKFLPEDPNNLPPIKEVFGATCSPEPFKVKCIERIG